MPQFLFSFFHEVTVIQTKLTFYFEEVIVFGRVKGKHDVPKHYAERKTHIDRSQELHVYYLVETNNGKQMYL